MAGRKEIQLNNGNFMPSLGLGTYNSQSGEVFQAVKDAIDAGYTHFDCAYRYNNESEIGAAISAKLAEGVFKREDLFITSKLWNTFHRPALVRPALEATLKNLNLSYLDLYLIHWPMAFKEEDEDIYIKERKVHAADIDYIDTWRAMESLVDAGLVKSIGISNFNAKQVDRLMKVARIEPVINQVESHPYLNQNKLEAHMKQYGIVLTAYCPLGSPGREPTKPGERTLLNHPVIQAIAENHKKNSAQVLIRFQIQKGRSVVPKSVTKSRIISNAEVYDFELTAEDMETLDALNKDYRFLRSDASKNHPDYPFHECY